MLLVGVAGAVLVLACADPERHRILTLLFDGVPAEDGREAPGGATTATSSEPGRAAPDGAVAPGRRALLSPDSPMRLTISRNHESFATNCDRCHEPDATVTNERCMSCHTERVHQEGLEVPSTCGSCHAEHSGRQADLTHAAADRCTECHDFAPFETEHPEFALVEDREAARQAKYGMGLEIFHSIHAKAPVPDGDRKGQACSCMDCHRLNPTLPDTFLPPTYDSICGRCHGSGVHKSVPQTSWKDLREKLPADADANAALLTNARWRAWLRAAPQGTATEAVQEVRNTLRDEGLENCFRCHSFEDREVEGAHLPVVPPTQYRSQWFRRLRFQHSAHGFLDCRHCHQPAPTQAEELGGLILPGKDVCAKCHHQKGASNACSTCHTFHTRTPWFKSDPEREQRVLELLNLADRS